jgi:hypothetical protein
MDVVLAGCHAQIFRYSVTYPLANMSYDDYRMEPTSSTGELNFRIPRKQSDPNGKHNRPQRATTAATTLGSTGRLLRRPMDGVILFTARRDLVESPVRVSPLQRSVLAKNVVNICGPHSDTNG